MFGCVRKVLDKVDVVLSVLLSTREERKLNEAMERRVRETDALLEGHKKPRS